MFENPVLELLSRVHPIVPPLIYLPVMTVALVRAIGHEGLGVVPVAGVFLAGLVTWSLADFSNRRWVSR